MPSKQTASVIANQQCWHGGTRYEKDETFSAPLQELQGKIRRGTVRVVKANTNAGPSDEAVAKGGAEYPRLSDGDSGWYDVLTGEGEKANEKRLRKDKADALLAEVKANG